MAVSLERLQANIVRATLPQSKATMGVFKVAQQDGDGDEGLQPVEFFCKVSATYDKELPMNIRSESTLCIHCTYIHTYMTFNMPTSYQ